MRRWLIGLLLLAGCVKPGDNRVEITYQTIETLPEQQALHQQIIAEFEKSHEGGSGSWPDYAEHPANGPFF